MAGDTAGAGAAGAGAGAGTGAGAPGAGAGGAGAPAGGQGAAGEGQTPVLTWDQVRSAIPEPLRKEKVWESVKDIEGLAKTFVESQKLIGSSVRIPKEDAPAEEWNKFYTKLGRPESARGYDSVPLPDLPDGDEWDKDLIEGFKKNAFDIGMSPRQFQSSLQAFVAAIEGKVSARKAALEGAVNTMREKWGAAYKNNVAYAKAAAQQIFGDAGVQLLDQSGLGNHPAILEGLVRLGKEFAEDGVIELGEAFTAPSSAQAEVDRIMNLSREEREKHPYWNDKLQGHREAVDRVYALREIIANTGN